MMSDSAVNLILKMNRFILKKGSDLESRRELVAAINTVTGEESLDAIYVNTTDNILIPDVAVIHLYHNTFDKYLLDPDDPDTCPFGYTVEIHERCFTKYTPEELSAVVIHDILQNVQTDTAKIRFIRAYTDALGKYDMSQILRVFSKVNLSEVLYIAFMQICVRPFRVPATDEDYTGTDEVLRTMGLADAYDDYLEKVLHLSNDDVATVIEREINADYRDVRTVVKACMNGEIRPYYNTIRNAVPLVTIQNVLTSRHNMESIGFNSRYRKYKRRLCPAVRPSWITSTGDVDTEVLSESFNNPKSMYDIRFQIDKIRGNMRYAESEAEREVVLFKIKQLQIKLQNTLIQLKRKPTPDELTVSHIKFIESCMQELDELREKTVNMEIKVKRWSVYCKDAMPEGYDY